MRKKKEKKSLKATINIPFFLDFVKKCLVIFQRIIKRTEGEGLKFILGRGNLSIAQYVLLNPI